MKSIFTLFICLFFSSVFSQDDVILLRHANSITMFSTKEKIPKSSVFKVRKPSVGAKSFKRKSNFTADPLVKNSNFDSDYTNSGYDRSHMMSAASNQYNEVGMEQSFYFTNVAPHTKGLNRKNWKKLEYAERVLADKHDSIKVICGNMNVRKYIGKQNIAVPEFCYKAIIIPKSALYAADTIVYLFPNIETLDEDMENYKTTFQDLQNRIILNEGEDNFNLTDLLKLNDCKTDADRESVIYLAMVFRINMNEPIDWDAFDNKVATIMRSDISFKESPAVLNNPTNNCNDILHKRDE